MGVVFLPRDEQERSDLARRLLAAAEELGEDKAVVALVTSPKRGFRVSREVASKAGVTLDVDDETGEETPAPFQSRADTGQDDDGEGEGESGEPGPDTETSDGDPPEVEQDKQTATDGEQPAPKKRGRPRKTTTEGA